MLIHEIRKIIGHTLFVEKVFKMLQYVFVTFCPVILKTQTLEKGNSPKTYYLKTFKNSFKS